MAALLVAVPLATVANSWDSLRDWRTDTVRTPVVVGKRDTAAYAGAQWRLTGLTRLKDGTAGSQVVAEFEAAVDDPAMLQHGTCIVALTDDKGRRWLPTFLQSRALRKAMPAVDKPRCASLYRAEKGQTAMLAETFNVPDDIEGVALTVTVTSALPETLVFR